MTKKMGIVLNIGTPNAPDTASVRKYLKEFLSDGEVVNIPTLIRIPLVHLWIAPRRAAASAVKYKKIWTDKGSPLLTHTQDFAKGLERELGFPVVVGMRYGQPAYRDAVQAAKDYGAEELLLLPMYPQFARATTTSSLNAIYSELKKQEFNPSIKVLKDFYDSKSFLSASVSGLKPNVSELIAGVSELNASLKDYDHVLFSFHGLPVSQVKRDPACQLGACCDEDSSCARRCYRAQCVRTADLLAKHMDLPRSMYSYSFQSRLGPVEWIKPFTDQVVDELVKSGVRRLLVLCPSFVADCLETLEELGMEVRQQFLSTGGQKFHLQACVNADPMWVKNFAKEIQSGQILVEVK